MKKRAVLLGLLVILAWVGCSNALDLNVTFNEMNGLKMGDRVLWGANHVGEVKKVTYEQNGTFNVLIRIDENFKNAATDQTRFVIADDPQLEGQKALEMIQVAEGGVPLKNDAVVSGSTAYDTWTESLRNEWNAFLDDLKKTPEEEWYKNLEKEMKELAETLRNSGEQTRKRLKEEVVPPMEEALKQFKKWLKDHGREKEAEPLDKQMDEIKSI